MLATSPTVRAGVDWIYIHEQESVEYSQDNRGGIAYMTIISRSDKFAGNQIQTCVIAGDFVILRAIYRQQDLAVMTATAREPASAGAVRPYPNQDALIATAERIFHGVGGDVTRKTDRSGRPYVQTVFPDAWATLSAIAAQVAAALELSDIRIINDTVLVDYWHDVAQDPLNEDELVYLFDGTYVTIDGRLVEQ